MAQALLQSASYKNARVVPVEPHVKSAKTHEMFNAGVHGNDKTEKSADPTCYNAGTVEIRTGLFDNVEMEMTQQYPAGGPREPVYALMRKLGFSESNWSDKFWRSADGIEVSIYGAGSMARISLGDADCGECELSQLSNRIDAIRAKAA